MPKARESSVRDLPVMKGMCKTCPFGEHGCKEVMVSVITHLLDSSQTCHSTGVALDPPREDTHICRGARDWQLQIMYRLGILEDESDEAWDKARSKFGL